MRHDRRQPHRFAAWLLSLALLLLALPTNAGWRCVNGAICPANCAAMQQAKLFRSASAPAAKPACERCAAASSSRPLLQSAGASAHSQCVFVSPSRPDAALDGKTALVAPVFILAASPFRFAPPCASHISLPYAAPASALAQRFLDSCPVRGPPVLL